MQVGVCSFTATVRGPSWRDEDITRQYFVVRRYEGGTLLVPHLADEARLLLSVVHALSARHGGRVVATALLGRQVGEEAG